MVQISGDSGSFDDRSVLINGQTHQAALNGATDKTTAHNARKITQLGTYIANRVLNLMSTRVKTHVDSDIGWLRCIGSVEWRLHTRALDGDQHDGCT